VSRSIILKFNGISEQRLLLMACWARGLADEVSDSDIGFELLKMCKEEIDRRQPKGKLDA